MPDCLDYSQTQRFSKLILDYQNQYSRLSSFYNRFPLQNSFRNQITDKASTYNSQFRRILVDALQEQYQRFTPSTSTSSHIQSLLDEKTFTVTTGHQLNLFTGPLYTFYKIVSVINTCKTLKAHYPEYNFVPVFWLASEDHDFDEINFFNYKTSKLSWDADSGGAVGEKTTAGLEHTFKDFKTLLGSTAYSQELLSLFEAAYLKHDDLSEASIYLYNQLFGSYGLVILEPNVKPLKALYTSYIEKEIFEEITYQKVSKTSRELKSLNYHQQVSPREINFFYKRKGLRERIIRKGSAYYINNTDISFSVEALKKEIKDHPEHFSPNALLRPLYQEVILPNLSYIGGGGELAYWLQLKSTFDAFEVTFPCIQLRNFGLLYTDKTSLKLKKMNMSLEDLFLPRQDLIDAYVKKASQISIDFSPQKALLSNQFKNLYSLAKQTDPSFLGAVAAQEKKQLKGLGNLEKRLLRAQRRKLSEEVHRLETIQAVLFPNANLQERVVNFSEVYEIYGPRLIEFLMESFKPFDYRFNLLKLQNYSTNINTT